MLSIQPRASPSVLSNAFVSLGPGTGNTGLWAKSATACFCKSSFIGTRPHPFTLALSVAALAGWRRYSWHRTARKAWNIIFTDGPFTERVCRSLFCGTVCFEIIDITEDSGGRNAIIAIQELHLKEWGMPKTCGGNNGKWCKEGDKSWWQADCWAAQSTYNNIINVKYSGRKESVRLPTWTV